MEIANIYPINVNMSSCLFFSSNPFLYLFFNVVSNHSYLLSNVEDLSV